MNEQLYLKSNETSRSIDSSLWVHQSPQQDHKSTTWLQWFSSFNYFHNWPIYCHRNRKLACCTGRKNWIVYKKLKSGIQSTEKYQTSVIFRSSESTSICYYYWWEIWQRQHNFINQLKPSQSLFLNQLLHVPSTTKSLLSVSKFALDNNVYFKFHPHAWFVKYQVTEKILI